MNASDCYIRVASLKDQLREQISMGWISGNNRVLQVPGYDATGKPNASHIEDIQRELRGVEGTLPSSRPSLLARCPVEYPFQQVDLPDSDLPFIPAAVVTRMRRPRLTVPKADELDKFPQRQDWWIVIDGIVYDCTDFVLEHPGGAQVIASFIGEDCSWQFWRFHSKTIMEEYGRELRIGRTDKENIVKRFQEKKRWAGSRKLGTDEW